MTELEIAQQVAGIAFPAFIAIMFWRYIERHAEKEMRVLDAISAKLDRIERHVRRGKVRQ